MHPSSFWLAKLNARRASRLAVVGTTLFLFVVRGHAAPYGEIISFGDSLTDVGNVAGLTVSGTAPLIPGYYQQTHFSNGPLWIEDLAQHWGLPPRTPGRATTMLAPQPDGNDWAWGGAQAAGGTDQPHGVREPIPNLLTAVSQYLLNHKPGATALVTIWSGADNLLVGGKYGPQAAADAAAAVKTAVEELAAAGARNFLLFNMPKLGDTPDAQAGTLQGQAVADGYTDSFNVALSADVSTLQHDPAFLAKITIVDVYSETLLIVTTVKSGGKYTPAYPVPGPPVAITNVTGEALSIFRISGTAPSGYMFWDDVHPTAQGHQIIAGLALQALGSP